MPCLQHFRKQGRVRVEMLSPSLTEPHLTSLRWAQQPLTHPLSPLPFALSLSYTHTRPSACPQIIGVLPQEDLPPKYLVKWRGLPYANVTWEGCRTLLTDQSAIRRYIQFEQLPPAVERKLVAQGTRPPKMSFKKIPASPKYKAGHTLRSYQLEGLNWLLFSWYNRRSVMLADEMGLGKTVQSVTTLLHIWQVRCC